MRTYLLTVVVAATLPACPATITWSPPVVAALPAAHDSARPVKHWVFFKDKGLATPAEIDRALAEVAAGYDPRAIERRRLRRTAPGLFDDRDLPVAPAYIDAVLATGDHHRVAPAASHGVAPGAPQGITAGVRLGVTSRWLNAISVYATAEQCDAIAALPFVSKVQPVARGRRVEVSAAAQVDALSDAPAESRLPPVENRCHAQHSTASGDGPMTMDFYGRSSQQIHQMRLNELHDQGLTGKGVIIGVLDTGFERSHVAFNSPDHPLRVRAEWDFVNDDGNTAIEQGDPDNQHEHGTLILGTLGAYQPNELVGGAFDAEFILAKVEDLLSEYPLEEDWFAAGLEFIEANGGDVATSSVVAYWYGQETMDGRSSVMAKAWNIAAENGLHGCQGAGNAGHDANPQTSSLTTPADAFDVLTIGAVDANGVIAGFSSDGPTRDGRIKPELLARGVATQTVDPFNPNAYTGASGTSLATPVACGAVACLLQAHPDWSVEQMRSALMSTGQRFQVEKSLDPLYVEGAGIIDAAAAHTASTCTGREGLRLKCKRGGRLKVTLKRGQPNAVVAFRLDDDPYTDHQVVTNGRGKVKRVFGDVGPGGHSVEVLPCGVRGAVECR